MTTVQGMEFASAFDGVHFNPPVKSGTQSNYSMGLVNHCAARDMLSVDLVKYESAHVFAALRPVADMDGPFVGHYVVEGESNRPFLAGALGGVEPPILHVPKRRRAGRRKSIAATRLNGHLVAGAVPAITIWNQRLLELCRLPRVRRRSYKTKRQHQRTYHPKSFSHFSILPFSPLPQKMVFRPTGGIL